MLIVQVPAMELFDPKTDQFINLKPQTLRLEHSLLSISLWEARWKTPFMKDEAKTNAQTLDYIRCMTINKDVDQRVYNYLPESIIRQIQLYVDDPMTATTFSDTGKSGGRKRVMTSEEFYYQMIVYGIPMEWEKRHLNRLITLLRIFQIRNSSPKKMSARDVAKRNHALNQQRRARLHSTG